MDFLQVIQAHRAKIGATAPIPEPLTVPAVTFQGIEVSDADKYRAIGDVLERVWLALTENLKRADLQTEQIPDWVDTLEWAVSFLPSGYERHRGVIELEMQKYGKGR